MRRITPSLGILAMGFLAAFGCSPGGSTPELQVDRDGGSSSSANLPQPGAGVVPAGPRVIDFDPPIGSMNVDPERTTLSVTFDRAMDPEGWAWVIENPTTAPTLGDSSWDPEVRTNTVVTELEPGRDYVLWVNSPQYLYFKGQDGLPAQPVRWTFSTAGGQPPAEVPSPGLVRSTPSGAPRAVVLDPPNGAINVDPSTTQLRATFDREMEPSWSWVTEGASFPDTTGDAFFDTDRRTAVLPVRLEPGRTYVAWLNSEQYQLFRDLQGVPARPLRWVFTTRAAE